VSISWKRGVVVNGYSSIKTVITEERFKKEIKEPLEKSIKNIQLEYSSSEDNADLYILDQGKLEQLFEQGLLLDFRLLFISQDRFEPNLLAWGKDDNGEVYALPYNNANDFPLFYNKSIFDKLDVPYPSDKMTWIDAIGLAGKVTANIDGRIMYGFDPADLALMRMQLAVLYLDSKTGQTNLLHEDWMRIARTLTKIYSLEGNILSNEKHLLRFNGYFVRDQTVAMGMICASCFDPKDLAFEWDIVSYPIYEDGPAWNANIPGLGLAISTNCSDPDAAFEIVLYLVADEHQRRNAHNGIRPSIIAPNDSCGIRYEQSPILRKKYCFSIYGIAKLNGREGFT
jgi:multiple sugar transport system substrate-binding protein